MVDGLLAAALQPPPAGSRPYRIAWVPQPDEELNERVRDAILSSLDLTNQDPVQLLDFNRAGRSIEEAELGLLGLAETRSNVWRQLADVYVWPVGVRPPDPAFPFPRASARRVVFRVCDGVNPPRSVTNAAPYADLTQLLREVRRQARQESAPALEAEAWRRQIAAETLPAWLGPIEEFRVDLAEAGQREPWLRKLAALELIAFLDPTHATARETLIRLCWSASSVELSRSPFLNRYRSSQAWEQHVARFGLQNRIPIREPHDRVACHLLVNEPVTLLSPCFGARRRTHSWVSHLPRTCHPVSPS